MWDLQRNGGSVNATTERILARGSLDAVGFFREPVVLLSRFGARADFFFFVWGLV